MAQREELVIDTIDMGKIIDEPIVMLGAERQRPGPAFIWRDQEHQVQSLGGQWTQRGRWWLGEGARCYFRITTLANITLDLCLDELAHTWTVAEIWD